MEVVVDALRPGWRRTALLLGAGALLFALYALWVFVSPTSMLSQWLRMEEPARSAGQQPRADIRPAIDAPAPAVENEEPPALLFRSLTADQARQVNAAMPFTAGMAKVAPFIFPAGDVAEREQATLCLTEAVYYEAGFEPIDGARAVAQVVLNRVRHPRFPTTVCGVVFEGSALPTGCQFSFTCDGARQRQAEPKAWERSRRIAEQALSGFIAPGVGDATHYHADYVVPYWMPEMRKLVRFGQQLFYRWPVGGGLTQKYGGSEVGVMGGVPAGAMTPKLKLLEVPAPIGLVQTADANSKLGQAAINKQKDVIATAPLSVAATQPVELAPAPQALPQLTLAPATQAISRAQPAALAASPACFGPTCNSWH